LRTSAASSNLPGTKARQEGVVFGQIGDDLGADAPFCRRLGAGDFAIAIDAKVLRAGAENAQDIGVVEILDLVNEVGQSARQPGDDERLAFQSGNVLQDGPGVFDHVLFLSCFALGRHSQSRSRSRTLRRPACRASRAEAGWLKVRRERQMIAERERGTHGESDAQHLVARPHVLDEAKHREMLAAAASMPAAPVASKPIFRPAASIGLEKYLRMR